MSQGGPFGQGRVRDESGMIPAKNFAPLFSDGHLSLQQICLELEHIKRTISQNDESLRTEIEEIDRDLDDEIHERKDGFDRLRREFEGFAHRRSEKVVHELEEFTKEQAVRDGLRFNQIAEAVKELNRLKLHLKSVQMMWSQLVNAISDPSRLPRCHQVRMEMGVVGQDAPPSES
mmetsp:Transcript_43430/g.86176  ORF Transcript_43430/g.86176 Transcript_43430/m.86176 type:complete len:175 (+) Transcript_43430:60-584(+)